MPKEGQKAPDFKLDDQNGDAHLLSDYLGKWVLVYFYPRDNTPGCTTEACEIRDSFPSFEELNAVVLGVSTDSEKSHKKFAEKHNLPFTLLADDDKKVIKLYGVYKEKNFAGKKFMGTIRTSFLIDPTGSISKVYKKVKPKIHAEEVIRDIKNLSR